MSLDLQADGTYLDSETGIVYDYSDPSQSAALPAGSSAADVQAAAVTNGTTFINTGTQGSGDIGWSDAIAAGHGWAWLLAGWYDSTGGMFGRALTGQELSDILNTREQPNAKARSVFAAGQSAVNSLAAKSQAGMPGSPYGKIPWSSLIALGVLLAVLATIHEVKEI